MIASTCLTCEAKTLRAYCIRCELNGQMEDHLRESRGVEAVPTEPNEGEGS